MVADVVVVADGLVGFVVGRRALGAVPVAKGFVATAVVIPTLEVVVFGNEVAVFVAAIPLRRTVRIDSLID